MKNAKNKISYKKEEVFYGYLFIAPFYILFLIFQLYPMIWSLFLSFYKWNGIGTKKNVGIGNYLSAFHDHLLMSALNNTFWYLLVNLIFIIPGAIFLGQMLCSKMLKCRKFHKTILVLPYITSTVAAGLIFSMLFDKNIGVINGILGNFGIAPIPWLTNVNVSKIPVMILSIWRNIPWYMLIVMSAILGIDVHLHEAAIIDGATSFQRMMKITLPTISPVVFFCVVNLTIDSARIFTEPYVLTNGGPGGSSLSIVQYLYMSGFDSFQLGYASTIGYILTFIMLVPSIFYFVGMSRKQKEDVA